MISYDLKSFIYSRDLGACVVCGNTKNVAIAHRIKQGNSRSKKNQTVNYIRKFLIYNYQIDLNKSEIMKIINHPLNMAIACNHNCNDSLNIFNNPVKRDNLLKQILFDMGYIK
jgi:hypothetical protein